MATVCPCPRGEAVTELHSMRGPAGRVHVGGPDTGRPGGRHTTGGRPQRTEALTLFVGDDDPGSIPDALGANGPFVEEPSSDEEVLKGTVVLDDGIIRLSVLRVQPQGQAGRIMRGAVNYARTRFPASFNDIKSHLYDTELIAGIVFDPPAMGTDDARIGAVLQTSRLLQALIFDGNEFVLPTA